MDTYDDPTATTEGEFTDGDALLGIPRTVLRSIWTNMIQRELINLVEGAGLTLDGDDFTQVLQAVTALAGSNGFETGDVKLSYRLGPRPGWLLVNGDTLGSAASLSDRAGDEYKNLYLHLWDTFDDTICPVTGGRGASALADFDADKPLQMMDDSGQFYRVADYGAAVDPGRTFGDLQDDQIQGFDVYGPSAFNRTVAGSVDNRPYVNRGGGTTGANTNWDAIGTTPDSRSVAALPIGADDTNGTPKLGAETRAKNRNINAFIKL